MAHGHPGRSTGGIGAVDRPLAKTSQQPLFGASMQVMKSDIHMRFQLPMRAGCIYTITTRIQSFDISILEYMHENTA